MGRPVDLVPACEAFVAVAERGSFTIGAASLQVSQPVVSRRVATLERTLGGQLLQRTARHVTLTRYGRAMLPAIRRVVEATDTLREQAALRRSSPLRLALPAELGLAELGRFCALASAAGVPLDVLQAEPTQRLQMLTDDRTDLAVVPAAADVARWRSPLGVAAARPGPAMRLESLRPRSGGPRPRLLWLLPEDDVPHLRDPLERYRDRHGLTVGQVRRATSTVQAVHRSLSGNDLVITTAADAARIGLAWRPIADLWLERGHLLSSSDPGRPAAADQQLLDLIGSLLDPNREATHAG